MGYVQRAREPDKTPKERNYISEKFHQTTGEKGKTNTTAHHGPNKGITQGNHLESSPPAGRKMNINQVQKNE